jgi:hypothetical protein
MDPVPESVQLTPANAAPRLTPNEMRLLRKETGFDLMELMGEDANADDRTQLLVWAYLRRNGYDPTWDQAGDVIVEWAEVDPTQPATTTTSPRFADSGESPPETLTNSPTTNTPP